jgi:multidrug efflux system membrane fusion protein
MAMGPAPVSGSAQGITIPSVVPQQSVRTIQSTARETTRLIIAEGDTSAVRRGIVTPRSSGIVADILASKGEQLENSQPIVKLDIPGFDAKREEARARLEEARRAFENAQTLADRGLASEDRLVSARTALASAEAQWASIQEQESDMTLSAPFPGVLNALDVEIGDSLSPGSVVAEVLDLSRLTVKASIPQSEVSSLDIGQSVSATLITGETVEGRITYISSQADRQTRSFPIEVEVANPDGALRAGVSTSLEMEGAKRMTHAVPAAYLSLGTEGELIVKSVEDGIVVGHVVEVVSSGIEELLVAGLPDEVEIITVGQGFVQPGDAVQTERIQ